MERTVTKYVSAPERMKNATMTLAGVGACQVIMEPIVTFLSDVLVSSTSLIPG